MQKPFRPSEFVAKVIHLAARVRPLERGPLGSTAE
jgi:hypothetical protein